MVSSTYLSIIVTVSVHLENNFELLHLDMPFTECHVFIYPLDLPPTFGLLLFALSETLEAALCNILKMKSLCLLSSRLYPTLLTLKC